MDSTDDIYERNKAIFTEARAGIDTDEIADHVRNAPEYLAETRRIWVGMELMWNGDFVDRLQGARVLEVGCGTGENALLMLAMGASHVVAQEITDTTADLVSAAAARLEMSDRIDVVIGDIRDLDLGEPGSYDVIAAKEVIHHIPVDQEHEFVARIAELVSDDGYVRAYDPCVNWPALDKLRWALPMPGRPSKYQKKKFAEWKANDPHPDRDNSTRHVASLFEQHFDVVESQSLGGLARLHRLAPASKDEAAAAFLQRYESRVLPDWLHERIAAVHNITATHPRRTQHGN